MDFIARAWYALTESYSDFPMETPEKKKLGLIVSMSEYYPDIGRGFESRPVRTQSQTQRGKQTFPRDVKSKNSQRIKNLPIVDLLEEVRLVKWNYEKPRSRATTATRYKYFRTFLEEKGFSGLPAREIKKHHIAQFRNWLLSGTSRVEVQRGPRTESKIIRVGNRSANNIVEYIGSFFIYLKDNYEEGMIENNPCKGLKELPTASEMHEVYSDAAFKAIGDYMKEHFEYVAFFSRFIFYCFMRPDEIRSIKIKHIDYDNRLIRMPAAEMKTGSKAKIKHIMPEFWPEIESMKLQRFNPEHYLFTARQRPGPKPANKTFFTSRFRKVREHFKLSDNHTMYGMRHTAVCQLLRAGVPPAQIMIYTGHRDFESFMAYARQILSEPPIDLSNKYSVHL